MSRSARTARPVVAATVAAGALLLAACSPTTTTLTYSPSDGTRVDLDTRHRGLNLLVVSDGDGAEGALFGALTNSSSEPATFRIEVDGAAPVTVQVEPRQTVNLGTEDGAQATLSAVDTIPGGYLDATLSTGEVSKDFALPVFDGTLPEYADRTP